MDTKDWIALGSLLIAATAVMVPVLRSVRTRIYTRINGHEQRLDDHEGRIAKTEELKEFALHWFKKLDGRLTSIEEHLRGD